MKIGIINGPNLNLLGKRNLTFTETKHLKTIIHTKSVSKQLTFLIIKVILRANLLIKSKNLIFHLMVYPQLGLTPTPPVGIGDAKSITTLSEVHIKHFLEKVLDINPIFLKCQKVF
jgi:hypothetical protein